MFWNSDTNFYGGSTASGGVSSQAGWSGWGEWQPWRTAKTAASQTGETPAPLTGDTITNTYNTTTNTGGQVNDQQVLGDPYALNPATFEGFLQKNVAELGQYSGLGSLVTQEQRAGYNDWMKTTEAGSATGANRYLGQLSQAGTIQSLVDSMNSSKATSAKQQNFSSLFESWVKNVGGTDAAKLKNLWDQGQRLDKLTTPNVSKHRRDFAQNTALMGRAGGFYSWNG